jgi:hypothetical protein
VPVALLEIRERLPRSRTRGSPTRPVESTRMIRDKRTWIAVNAVGAVAGLFLLVSWAVSPPTNALFPPWFLRVDAAFIFGAFIYNIIRRLHGPIQPARWARNMSDNQLWITKGLLTVVLIGVTIVVIFWRIPRP